jgi:hypothetical protein
MVKTLRITTLLIAIVALALIIFIAAKGIASDKDMEKFLAAPGIAEQLQASSTGNKAPDIERDTLLVRQAKQFALRINPPPPPAPVRVEPPPEAQRPKAAITAKFTLVGTSYHTGDEKNSWALINEVGKGWHWVKQGSKVGYLTIERIGDGIVLIRDGSSTYELVAERQQKPDYVKSFTGELDKTTVAWRGTKNTVTEAISQEQEQSPVSSTENAQPVPTEEPKVTKEQVQENINWIKQMQENPESLGMTAEEAKELGGLGDMLKTLETELKTVESNAPEANEPNAAAEPNSVKIKDANEQKSSPEITEKQRSEPNKAAPVPLGRGLRRR